MKLPADRDSRILRTLFGKYSLSTVESSVMDEAHTDGRRKPIRGSTIWLVMGLASVLAMPTAQSFWIDEGTTASKAAEGTISRFVDRLMAETQSDSQWPLGMFYFWAGARLFGVSEVSLRMMSAIWVGVGFLILWSIGKRLGMPYLSALYLTNAFVWYYASEARPYTMQIALGAALLFSVVVVISSQSEYSLGLGAFLVSGPLLCATGMLGAVPFGVVALILTTVLVSRGFRPTPGDWIRIGLSGSLVTATGCYYAWTLVQGKGAGTVGTWGVGLKNLCFSAYELLGFVGFGPGRQELRDLALSEDLPGAVRGLSNPLGLLALVLALFYVWALIRFCRLIAKRRWPAAPLGVVATMVVLASTGILLCLSVVVDFPFWGRHLAPIAPFAVFVVGAASNPSERNKVLSTHILPVGLCVLLLTSSMFVRFHPTHSRDDYRQAAGIARAAVSNGKVVWWVADLGVAEYYGVRFCREVTAERSNCVQKASNKSRTQLDELPEPDCVVVSKPDLHDNLSSVREYLVSRAYSVDCRPKSFDVFIKSPERP